jgi:hypothetical protein
VLAIWGTSDWLVDRTGNAWIAEIVNRVKPGNGTFVALDSIDHFFLRTATPEESYRYFKPVKEYSGPRKLDHRLSYYPVAQKRGNHEREAEEAYGSFQGPSCPGSLEGGQDCQ